MKIEIWSDIVCPFCYIGKRRFEKALNNFAHKGEVSVIWKSYQLSPGLKTDPSKNPVAFLAEHKGISIEEAQRLNDYVTQMAAGDGLIYNLNIAIAANSLNAHRLLHLAKMAGVQSELKENLFSSYFTAGRNIDDITTLLNISEESGLKRAEAEQVLTGNSYTADVEKDIYEAHQIGVRGVPFFLFYGKYAVSGAQDISVFTRTLEAAYAESKLYVPEKYSV